MTHIHISANATGSRFFPSKLPEKWDSFLLDRIDVGAIAKIGRYRGQLAPQGHVLIALPEGKDLPDLVALLEEMKADLVASGVDEISVFITLDSDDQANWVISTDTMTRLGKLKADLLISCVQAND